MMQLKIWKFIEKNTSGFPLLVWLALWVVVFIFLFVFRNEPNVDFGKLKYVVSLGIAWFVGSDMVRKRRLFSPRSQLIFDTLFSVIFYNTIIRYGGGVSGGMMITLVAAMVFAPFFTGNRGTIFLVSSLSLSVLFFHIFFVHDLDRYDLGLVVIQLITSLAVVAVVRHYSGRKLKGEDEQIVTVRKEVDFKTQELQKTLEELNRNRSALRDKISKLEQFQKLVVGRELKMIELKTQIRKLEEEIRKIKSEKEKR